MKHRSAPDCLIILSLPSLAGCSLPMHLWMYASVSSSATRVHCDEGDAELVAIVQGSPHAAFRSCHLCEPVWCHAGEPINLAGFSSAHRGMDGSLEALYGDNARWIRWHQGR